MEEETKDTAIEQPTQSEPQGQEQPTQPEPQGQEPAEQPTAQPTPDGLLQAMRADPRVAHFIAAVLSGQDTDTAAAYLTPQPEPQPEKPKLGLYETFHATELPPDPQDASTRVLMRQPRSVWNN